MPDESEIRLRLPPVEEASLCPIVPCLLVAGTAALGTRDRKTDHAVQSRWYKSDRSTSTGICVFSGGPDLLFCLRQLCMMDVADAQLAVMDKRTDTVIADWRAALVTASTSFVTWDSVV